MIVISHFSKEGKKNIIANLNRFITMLLGGLWHGASFNFIIWGGLNGVGMIVYQLWKKTGWHLRMLFMTCLSAGLIAIRHYYPLPIWNLLTVWMLVIYAGFIVRYIYHLCKGQKGQNIGYLWGVAQTFTFITFTRLFFRSGSNLDPKTANIEAWNTAQNMVNQIGGKWNTSIIPDICAEYWEVFSLILLGMIIHWLPSKMKRWYRMNFALLPLPIMIVMIAVTVLVIYQFMTADTQAFIYFQF
jgi:Ca2+/Na+ antiporter